MTWTGLSGILSAHALPGRRSTVRPREGVPGKEEGPGMNRKRINRWTAIGEPPSETQLRSISLSDYKSVLDVRARGETEPPLPSHREEVMAKSLGLAYGRLDLASESLGEEDTQRFRDLLRGLPRPVFIHGRPTGMLQALALIGAAIESGWSGERTLEKAQALGLAWDASDLRDFVKAYVDRNRS